MEIVAFPRHPLRNFSPSSAACYQSRPPPPAMPQFQIQKMPIKTGVGQVPESRVLSKDTQGYRDGGAERERERNRDKEGKAGKNQTPREDSGMRLGWKSLNDLLLGMSGQVPAPGQEQSALHPLGTSHLQSYVSGTTRNLEDNQLRRAPVWPSPMARCLAQVEAHINPYFLSGYP